MIDILKMRNIGISAHIDSGKTTLTERMLFYCKKIHAIHEVRGKDGVGATMDSMELEKERGITIASAATNVEWNAHSINIIDTPGHVDFTIEVERALRVLDGAVLVLCAVGGVQSQSITVDRQLKRYRVPRIAFINKCDRTGSDPYKITKQLRDKLGLNAVMLQLPIGLEEKFVGLIDLVEMKAVYFDGESGETLRVEEIPVEQQTEAAQKREELLDAISMFDDELAENFLEGSETTEQIKLAIRKGVLSLKLTPVCVGSAYKNKGVQPLMNAVVDYLPSPVDVTNEALDLDNEEKPIKLPSDPDLPVVALAFKLEDGVYGQLTYIRIYQGTLKKGLELLNTRSRKKIKVGRLIRMHSDAMEDIDKANCGDIVALFGVDCVSGDTFTQDSLNYAMTSMYVPKTVISLALKPTDKKSSDTLAKALNRFTKEDPTFQVHVDPDSRETIIRGMGELHLDVYVERMRREYKISIETGMPQVAYRETITQEVAFEYTHKKQTGGSGQFAKIQGIIRPNKDEDFVFISSISGGSIPKEYIPSCEKGFKKALDKDKLLGFPVLGVEVEITDGLYHPVDSSDMAFQIAAQSAFRENYHKAVPIILEPIMLVTVECPTEFQGNVFSSINQRRGIIISSTENAATSVIEAEVPLSEMFGYSTVLRSMSQGKAEYSMELASYKKVPKNIQDDLIKEMNQKKK